MSSDNEITLPLDVVMAWRKPQGDAFAPRKLVEAIDAALWKPPEPVRIQIFRCDKHPHPTDGTFFLALIKDHTKVIPINAFSYAKRDDVVSWGVYPTFYY